MTKFTKMNGLGNDFVIIDNRNQNFELTEQKARWIAYRRFGIGCDQIAILSNSDKADVKVNFYNSDGSESGACGNASRCIGYLLTEQTGKAEGKIETNAGILETKTLDNAEVTVNMGEPVFDWDKIPLAIETDPLNVPIAVGPLEGPAAVSMGNPHIVFFVDNIDEVNLRSYGPMLEKHEMFPQRTNVTVAEIDDEGNIRSKVWERGSGKTLACGTAACATVVLAFTLDMIENPYAYVEQPGGKMFIEWKEDGNVFMTGKVSKGYVGEFDDKMFG